MEDRNTNNVKVYITISQGVLIKNFKAFRLFSHNFRKKLTRKNAEERPNVKQGVESNFERLRYKMSILNQ